MHTNSTDKGDVYADAAVVTDSMKEYYGRVLQMTEDLKTYSYTSCRASPAQIRAAIEKLPPTVIKKFYGCGNPIPTGIDG
jgi:arsenite methyltransferase